MNKTLPSYMPLAVVIVAAAVAGVALFSTQSGSSNNVAVTAPQESQSVPAGTVAVVSESSANTASAAVSVGVGQSKRVSWNASDYPSATVVVTIIRKTSDSPLSYQPLRIMSNVPNNGSIVWVPTASEIGNNVFVEVGCTSTAKACQAHISPVSYSVTK